MFLEGQKDDSEHISGTMPAKILKEFRRYFLKFFVTACHEDSKMLS